MNAGSIRRSIFRLLTCALSETSNLYWDECTALEAVAKD